MRMREIARSRVAPDPPVRPSRCLQPERCGPIRNSGQVTAVGRFGAFAIGPVSATNGQSADLRELLTTSARSVPSRKSAVCGVHY
jgi:hypothetical protein